MQYAVPQFTDVEDKLIGPLTLKQFLVVLATGGVLLFFYSLLKVSLLFFVFALPVGLLGLGLAFGKFNARPLYEYFGAMISFVIKPQVRIFKREEPDVTFQVKSQKSEVKSLEVETLVPTESRLKKLAYLLDQKTAEEKELINK